MVQKKKIIAYLFVFLTLQYLILAVVELAGVNFWPAFSLPGFKKVYGKSGIIEYTKYSIVHSNERGTHTHPMKELWMGIPDVQKRAIFRSAIKKSQKEIIRVSEEEYAWYMKSIGTDDLDSKMYLRASIISRSIDQDEYEVLDVQTIDYEIEKNEDD